ncbi:MAG: GNAT family N-acetyltransferase [Chloroflexota bacterium]
MRDWRSELTIRPATDADVPALRLLVNAAYRELADLGMNYTGTYQDEALTRERMRGRDVYLAFDGERLVATISTDVREQNGRPTLYISQFAVQPDLKRQGIGRHLMDYVEQVARQRGITRLGLDTATRAHHLVRFYQSLGFRIVAEEHWEGKTYNSYVMEKDLDAPAVGPLRPATEADMAELVALVKDFFDHHRRLGNPAAEMPLAEAEATTRDWLARGEFHVAAADGEIVGFVRFDRDGDVFWLADIGVRADRRSQGYGSALLRQAEDYVRRAGGDALYLHVTTRNLAALDFYMRHGYDTVNTIELYKPLVAKPGSAAGSEQESRYIEISGRKLRLR